MDVIQLLEYLQEVVDGASKMPMTGKVLVDKKEIMDVVEQIIAALPDEFKKAQWVVGEKDRILTEASKEYDSIRQQTVELMQKQLDNHDVTKEAQMRAEEIIVVAQTNAKNIRLGARDYADEVISQLDAEVTDKTQQLITRMENNLNAFLDEIQRTVEQTTGVVRENIKELRRIN